MCLQNVCLWHECTHNIHRTESRSTHNIEFEQRDLGAVGLDGRCLHCARKVEFHNTRLEGKHRHLTGINLQIHQKTRKHLGKLQRERGRERDNRVHNQHQFSLQTAYSGPLLCQWCACVCVPVCVSPLLKVRIGFNLFVWILNMILWPG